MSIIGPASLGVLLFDMLLVLAMTFCFAEASGLFKDNGGPYIYAKEAFGNFIGYEVGFLTWITRIIAFSTMGVGFATALGGIMPELSTPMMKNIIVTVIFALLAIMNLFGVQLFKVIPEYGNRCQNSAVCAFYRHGRFLYRQRQFYAAVPRR